MVLVWLPGPARESLDLLRRPGLTHLERCLAGSILVAEVKRVLAGGPVSETWKSLIQDEMRRHCGDLVDEEELGGT